eukprot:5074197-Pyramimonas_sp.AAC.1
MGGPCSSLVMPAICATATAGRHSTAHANCMFSLLRPPMPLLRKRPRGGAGAETAASGAKKV